LQLEFEVAQRLNVLVLRVAPWLDEVKRPDPDTILDMPEHSRRRRSQPRKRTPILNTPRVAIYHRVSTLDQDPGLARAELGAWAERQGGELAMTVEESASGVWNARPGLQRIMDAARRGEVDVVVVWKLDRWGRSALDVLSNIEQLSNAGVRFVATSQGIDIRPDGDAMGRLMITMLAAVAEFERDLISERTRLGLEKARRAGRRLGRPPKARPSPEEVAELREQGMSWRKLAKHLGVSVNLCRRRYAEHAEG
jgi:DNA invertase Pin-like site-specific DNA recombinase